MKTEEAISEINKIKKMEDGLLRNIEIFHKIQPNTQYIIDAFNGETTERFETTGLYLTQMIKDKIKNNYNYYICVLSNLNDLGIKLENNFDKDIDKIIQEVEV